MLRPTPWLWMPLLLVLSCALTTPTQAIDPDLAQHSWKLVDFPGVTVPAGQTPTLKFTTAGHVQGQGSCNSFQGSFESGTSGEFDLQLQGWTEKACTPVETHRFDERLSEAFQGIDEYSLDDGWLLLWENGAIVLEYRAVP